MEQELQDLASEKIVDEEAIRIRITLDSSKMVIEADPHFALIYIIIVVFLFLTVLIFSSLDANDLPLWTFLGLIMWGVFIVFIFTTRKFRCLINKATGNVRYFRGGILATKIDESISNFEIKDITSIEMKRFVQRYGDTFQVRLLVGSQTSFELTGKDLKFSKCQSYAEIIKDFIDPALPIKAVD